MESFRHEATYRAPGNSAITNWKWYYYSRWAGAYYLQQRRKGGSHHTAVRALAFKWQRVIWRCWQNHTPYDDARYEAVLRQRNSPVVALLDCVQLGKSPWKNPAKKN